MAVKPINWTDIALHTVPAVIFAVMAGAAATLGWTFGGVVGALFIAGSVIVLAVGIGYWLGREWLQHKRAWGGRQSTLEWLVPAGASILAYPVGFGIGLLLLI